MAWDTKARVDKALMLFRQGYIDLILCTGGIFQKGQRLPASRLMAEYLREQGVPKEALLTEEQSVDTAENIKFSLSVLKKNGLLKNIRTTEDLRFVLISERLHLRRIEITMQAYLKKIRFESVIPLIMEPVWYSLSDSTLHTEEAAYHLTATDTLGESKLFEDTRQQRKREAERK